MTVHVLITREGLFGEPVTTIYASESSAIDAACAFAYGRLWEGAAFPWGPERIDPNDPERIADLCLWMEECGLDDHILIEEVTVQP